MKRSPWHRGANCRACRAFTFRRLIDTLLRVDLVILDEPGFAPLDPTGSQLFFRFIAAAYERRRLGIASHWPFDQWGHFLPDETTCCFDDRPHPSPRGCGRHRG